MDTISLLVPTRGRPERCAEMWRSARDLAAHPELVELILYVDADEPEPLAYADWATADDRVTLLVGDRIILSEMWNVCAKVAGGNIMWHGNDDVIFRSAAWDEYVRDEFGRVPDRIVLVHGRDGIHDAAAATLGFLHRRWYEHIGYFVPPYFASDYNDTWLTEVANELGRRRFVPEVYTEHMHPVAGKGPWDLTHQERMTRHAQQNVDQLYASLAPERREWAARLRLIMEVP